MGLRLKILTILIVSMTMFLSAGKSIVVDLNSQQAIAYENGQEIMRGNVSTGRVGHRTPTGHFRILEKELRHISSKYPKPNGGARMDYMMRLTNYGVAMHLGYVPNYPASHGCIRMENGFAQKMFRWASVGTPVIIKGYPPLYVDRGGSSFGKDRKKIVKISNKDFNGNIPLKLLSSVPGKAESVLSDNYKSSYKNKKRVITPSVKMKPLEMLKG